MNNSPRDMPPKIRLLIWSTDGLGKKMLVRSEQKGVDRMMDNGSKFCNVEELVIATYAGILATAKAYFLQHEHRRIARCKKDSTGFQDLPLSLVKLHSKTVLSPYSGIAGSKNANEANKLLLKNKALLT